MKHTVEEIVLKNGARGLLIDAPDAPVVNFDFNFRAGDYLSPAGKPETAHIMEHLVLGANARYKKSTDYSREFSKNGAYNNASTGSYHMNYIAECAEFEAMRILDLLCVAIEAPLFLESEFKAEVANVREELKSRRNNHMGELSLAIGKELGMVDLTYTERSTLVDTVTLDDIKEHYARTHGFANLRFVIGGKITDIKPQIIERLEALTLPSGDKRIALPDEPLTTVSETLTMHDASVENVYYRWETGIDHVLTDEEDYDFEALMGLLLGSMHSRIFGTARERGLVYGINYGKYHTAKNHLWYICGQVLPQNIEELFRLMAEQLRAIADGDLTEQEVADIKQYALGNFQRGHQTVSSVLDSYYDDYFFNETIEDFSKFKERVEAVTSTSIIAAANQCLRQDSPWALGFYGATDQIDIQKLRTILSATYRP